MNNLNHLGEFEIIGNDKKYDFLIFDKYTSVDFILDNDVTIKLNGALIQSVSYTSNSNIVIYLLSFSPLLYDCMISGNKIKTIRTHELRLDLKTHDEIECESIYNNFEFENYSVSEDIHNNNEYIYVLKGV
jgi:hypothetical protein